MLRSFGQPFELEINHSTQQLFLQEAIANLRQNKNAEHINYAVDISEVKSEF